MSRMIAIATDAKTRIRFSAIRSKKRLRRRCRRLAVGEADTTAAEVPVLAGFSDMSLYKYPPVVTPLLQRGDIEYYSGKPNGREADRSLCLQRSSALQDLLRSQPSLLSSRPEVQQCTSTGTG